MGRPYKDLTNQQFGFLTALKDVGRSKSGDVLWECECSCPERNHVVVTSSNLQRLHTQSCGCYFKIANSKAHKKETVFDIVGDIAIGCTSKNEQFFVDAYNVEKLKHNSWWYNARGYLVGYVNGELTFMHRFITNCDNEHVVDHKNHITGDNRIQNLRVCTVSENQYNRSMQNNNKSGAIGVCWDQKYQQWRAYISVNKKKIELGHFSCFDEAVQARRDAENKYHKEFSLTNSITGGNVNV